MCLSAKMSHFNTSSRGQLQSLGTGTHIKAKISLDTHTKQFSADCEKPWGMKQQDWWVVMLYGNILTPSVPVSKQENGLLSTWLPSCFGTALWRMPWFDLLSGRVVAKAIITAIISRLLFAFWWKFGLSCPIQIGNRLDYWARCLSRRT